MTPFLHVQLLGGFRLYNDNIPITTLDMPRLQALLAYLILHREIPQPRAQIAFQLWPDTTEAQARSNLRNLLHRLRAALPDADRFLQADTQTLQWRPDAPCMLDVADFDSALAQARQAERGGDQFALRAALTRAADRYLGELLPGHYDDWILLERERLHQACIAALERLTLLLEEQREYLAAISYARRLLRYDPVHEATYLHLMRLHARSGDRASGVRVYQTCAAVLERELGVEPSPATRAAYERLCEQAASIEPEEAERVSTQNAPSSTAKHNLPAPLTSFIGRARERSSVAQLLATTRLLTLTGAGGGGKTRLALAVAADLVPRYRDGVWLVELAALTEAALLPSTVAAALGIREEQYRPLSATIVDALRSKELLVVLDNCEHMVDACAHLAATLLSACPHLRILSTSREALGLVGETAWFVPSLALPAPQQMRVLDQLVQVEAVQLFVERAAAALPTFALTEANAPAVVAICRQLDGIPLAIELAAARVKLLSVEQLAARLDDCFRLLVAGSRAALPRQQSLLAVIDWSHALLTEVERVLFRRLAVFAGGWTLEAAEAVCAETSVERGAARSQLAMLDARSSILDVLARLVDKSLVVVDIQDGRPARYRLLETVRQYGRERLQDLGELEAAQRRHAHFFLALAEAVEPQLWSVERAAWLARLDIDYDNLRAALAWSQTPAGDPELGLRFVGALWWFWFMRSSMHEGWAWITSALERRSGTSALARAKVLPRAGIQAWFQSDYLQAGALCAEGLTLARELGDKRGTATALHGLGLVALDQGEMRAAALLEESLTLARELGDIGGVAWSLFRLGQVEWWLSPQGDALRAARLFEQSLELFRQVGDSTGIAHALFNLSSVYEHQGDLARASALSEENLALCRQQGDKVALIYALYALGQVARRQGDHTRATALYQESLLLCQDLGERRCSVKCLEGLASVAEAQAQPERAVRLFGSAAALREAISYPLTPIERADCDRTLSAARARLDRTTFELAWSAGRAMTPDRAIGYAAEQLAVGASRA